MKKVFLLFTVFALALTFSSCEEETPYVEPTLAEKYKSLNFSSVKIMFPTLNENIDVYFTITIDDVVYSNARNNAVAMTPVNNTVKWTYSSPLVILNSHFDSPIIIKYYKKTSSEATDVLLKTKFLTVRDFSEVTSLVVKYTDTDLEIEYKFEKI